MEALIMAAQLILGLSILVGLHELGHLFAAKLFGMRVEQYSIGFPPKLFSFRIGETEYSLSAIPLGGFVKISGMVDESLDTEQLSKEPEPWEFRAKPAWQRLIVMLGGIIVNVITGVIIFIALTFAYGETYIPKEELNKHGIVAYELAEEIGLQDGDKIINVNGQDYQKYTDLTSSDVLLESGSYYTIDRNGEEKMVTLPSDILDKFASNKGAFIGIREPFFVKQVDKSGNAYKAGLRDGDKITRLGDQNITYFHELTETLAENKGKKINMIISREGEGVVATQVEVSEDGKIGFMAGNLLERAHQDYTLMEAVPIGTKQAFHYIWANAKGLGKLFTGEVSPTNSVSGPIGIAKFFGGTWDWYRFWHVVGLLSMVLAFMNFLPIPALDGGHVMFLLYEMISGRAPSDKFLEVAQKVGMVVLLSIMVFAIGNDIFREVKEFFF